MLSHTRIIFGNLGCWVQQDPSRGMSRWKLHLGHIADSAEGGKAQKLHRARNRAPFGKPVSLYIPPGN
jgi:hypothetical protein